MAQLLGTVTAVSRMSGDDPVSGALKSGNFVYIVLTDQGQNLSIIAGKQEFAIEDGVLITVSPLPKLPVPGDAGGPPDASTQPISQPGAKKPATTRARS